CVDDADRAGSNRPGHGILSVGRHVDIVNLAFDGNGLHVGERCGIDDIHRAGRLPDADIYMPAILSHVDIIRAAAQLDALEDLERLRVDHVEGYQRFVSDVDPASIGRDGDAVRNFDVFDDPNHFVSRGVDYVNVISR